MLSLLIGYYAVRHLVLILTLKWAKLIFKHRQSSWVCKHLQFLLTCLQPRRRISIGLNCFVLVGMKWEFAFNLLPFFSAGAGWKTKVPVSEGHNENMFSAWMSRRGERWLLFTPRRNVGYFTALGCDVRDPDLSPCFAWFRSALPDNTLDVWNFSEWRWSSKTNISQ